MIEGKKIVVIADDFTGAAEIGGIGLRNGLRVAIETELMESKDVDLLVLATDTRSLPVSEATKVIKKLTKEILQLNPFLIYKKIDSVLRGNVSEEIEAQLDVMNLNKSIIIAGNPIFNRVIKDGKYFIDHIPLQDSHFVPNSQHPITTNEILKIISSNIKYPLYSRKNSDSLPDKGLIMGDVESIEDLHKWTQFYSNNILFAGASGFFNSLLKSLKLYNPTANGYHVPSLGEKRLFVLGSYYPKNNALMENMVENGHYHANMPFEIYNDKNYSHDIFKKWQDQVLSALEKHQKVIVSSLHTDSKDPDIHKRVKKEIAELVVKVCDRVNIDEILVEGGSTTSEIIDKLNINHLTPMQELDTGVIRMQIESMPGLCLTTKPGSYLWPESVWLNSENKINNNTTSKDITNNA